MQYTPVHIARIHSIRARAYVRGRDITFTRQNATHDRLELSYLVG